MKIPSLVRIALVVFSLPLAVRATTMAYVNAPQGNTAQFITDGGSSLTTFTFDDLATGSLNSNAYAGMTFSGNFNQVVYGAGPSQPNISFGTLSPGDGGHVPSNYLQASSPGTTNTFTVNFASAVSGVGITTIDAFAVGGESLTISVYNSANALLGSYSFAGYNFQINNQYFMGVISSTNDISRMTFTQNAGQTGDILGLDNLRVVGMSTGTSSVPDSGSTVLLMGGALAMIAAIRRRIR